jgi:hypothetical protein
MISLPPIITRTIGILMAFICPFIWPNSAAKEDENINQEILD